MYVHTYVHIFYPVRMYVCMSLDTFSGESLTGRFYPIYRGKIIEFAWKGHAFYLFPRTTVTKRANDHHSGELVVFFFCRLYMHRKQRRIILTTCLYTVKNDALYSTHLIVCKLLGVLICTPCVMQHSHSVDQHAQGVTQHPCRDSVQCYTASSIQWSLNQLSQQQAKFVRQD